MTPDQFISKWKNAELKERAAAQSHFIDLCRVLNEPAPTDVDPTGDFYAFEKGATKTTGGEGWADVWKRGHFGWEYKGPRKDLDKAFAQLQQYALALENPPLLVVCDLDRFRIHTNWTNSVSQVHEFTLDDLRRPEVLQKLKWTLSDPEQLRPGKTRQVLTEEAAAEFARLAQRLRERGHDPQVTAHFVNRLVFCMFAEDVGLLPNRMFARMLEHAADRPAEFQALAGDLFRAMKTGGRIGFEPVEWFNGGLFDNDEALPLTKEDIALVLRASRLDWAEIDPSILGTLFERGLDPDKRAQLGAHYTDREKIMLIVEPVVIRPWLAEWETAKADIAAALQKAQDAKSPGARTRQREAAGAIYRAFLDRLRAFRVLDPACGSGNFLYLSLLALKDLEHRAGIEAEAMGLPREFPQVGPQSVKGIEINPYAAELARVTVWIGEIQWMRRNGFDVSRQPILKPLETIECRDALMNPDGTEAFWPEADAIVGNPPFLGDKFMKGRLGVAYTEAIRRLYQGRVPGGADLVCFWFAKAHDQMRNGRLMRAGLVATNSIRGGANRSVLDRIADQFTIVDAWSDEPWTIDGAAVRVSLICFAREASSRRLDGSEVARINPDLTSSGNIASARPLLENRDIGFIGTQKSGPFDISGELAREWLQEPSNPNGRPNADVLRPWANGMDVARRPSGRWVIDFGTSMPANDAALYTKPFEHVSTLVRPMRSTVRRDNHRLSWWLHGEARPGMRKATRACERMLVTPRVAKHRVFVWLSRTTIPDCQLVVIARDDDTTFGILHSRFHEAWALRMGTSLEDRPRYTPSTTFETFPFPEGLTPNIPASDYAEDPRAQRIAAAAQRLNELRENWLNPPDLVRREPEVVPGFPDRILPVDERAAAILKKRTLTNLYNERPTWLDNAHKDLDRAVAAAYGWPEDISTEEALERLFVLNQERAAAQSKD